MLLLQTSEGTLLESVRTSPVEVKVPTSKEEEGAGHVNGETWARRARIDEGTSQGEEKGESASTTDHDVDSLVAQIKQMRAEDREESMDMLAREGRF